MTTSVKTLICAAGALAFLAASPALASLKVGDRAPQITLPAATNGHVATFSLKSALKKGPVVLYFYPKAFTSGCSLEAHEFSVNMPKFKAKHVTVVGVSADDIKVLKDFSKKDCGGNFAVAADPHQIASIQYDAKMGGRVMASRISYVIGKNGKIAFVHEDPDASTMSNACSRPSAPRGRRSLLRRYASTTAALCRIPK